MILTPMEQVQSCSLCVPSGAKKCVADCKGCVSKMHTYCFPTIIKRAIPLSNAEFERWVRAFEYSSRRTDNLMITGDNADPLQNLEFLMFTIIIIRKLLQGIFSKAEIQSIGYSMDEFVAKFLADELGISCFALSAWGLKNKTNQSIARLPISKAIDIGRTCELIKSRDMLLRLSLNLSKDLMEDVGYDIGRLINECKRLGADQITLRAIYDEGDSEQARWAREHRIDKDFLPEIERYVILNKDPREPDQLITGYSRVFIKGMSLVVDPDCMDQKKTAKLAQKYLVIRTDGHVYDDWGPDSRVL